MGKGTLGVRVSEHGAGQFEGRVECSQFTQQPVRWCLRRQGTVGTQRYHLTHKCWNTERAVLESSSLQIEACFSDAIDYH